VSEALYHPDVGLVDLLRKHLWTIVFAGLIALLILLGLHDIYLRRAVRLRTVDLENKERQLQQLNKELEQLSMQDSLTGIANRRMFDQALEREWFRALRNGQPISLMMVDIDHFKLYNDYYGHLEGDACLIRIAQTLNEIAKRGVDLCARYGGEEFVLLLPGTKSKDALHLAEDCRNRIIEEGLPHDPSEVSDVVTISIGVCTVTPSGDSQPTSLIREADKLLYKAKAKGRNRTETMNHSE
jgi:diguanylate cyclase (GGDEF)-like protein